ncbi:MAG: tRNA pseudouridine(38-40) synthase TruA [Candidatus Omnitrophota bacterium]
MLKNICLELEYDGANYYGWQIQTVQGNNKRKTDRRFNTVQEEVEGGLRRLFCKKLRVVYAGRTDRGVHAYSQCVNFTVDAQIPLKNIKAALNSFLPPDISIKKIKYVPLDFHARFSVKSKIYRYVLCTKKRLSVFERNYVWHCPGYIDITRMQKAASYIFGRRDFSFFAKQPRVYETCVRKIFAFSIRKKTGYIIFDIEADGFLRNMARNIVSFLVAAGQGKVELKEIPKIIRGEKTCVKKPAPASGLYLYKINY